MREYPAMPRAFAHLSDEAVVALVARSDQEALAELYDRFGRVAYGLALRVLRDEKLAEDAVQEAFLAAWRNADRFLPERAKASTRIGTPLGVLDTGNNTAETDCVAGHVGLELENVRPSRLFELLG